MKAVGFPSLTHKIGLSIIFFILFSDLKYPPAVGREHAYSFLIAVTIYRLLWSGFYFFRGESYFLL